MERPCLGHHWHLMLTDGAKVLHLQTYEWHGPRLEANSPNRHHKVSSLYLFVPCLQAMFLCTLVYITVGVCGYTAFKDRYPPPPPSIPVPVSACLLLVWPLCHACAAHHNTKKLGETSALPRA